MQALLKLAELPRSTYYYWIQNSNRPDKDKELKILIQNIYDEHQGRYGYRRIRDELMNQGHKINHKKSSTNYERVRFKESSSYEKISLV